MARGAGQDLAVVMFSGHGTVIDGQFYLVPYGADDSTPARLKASAIPATEFQGEILKARRAWPGPGFARRLPLCGPDLARTGREPAESSGCRQRDGADLLDGRQALARG